MSEMNAVILGFGELALLERGQEQKVDKEEEGASRAWLCHLCLQTQVELLFHSEVSVSVKEMY